MRSAITLSPPMPTAATYDDVLPELILLRQTCWLLISALAN